MNAFTDSIQAQSQVKLTENGAVAYNTTGSALLDLFGTIGSMRTRSDADITNKFLKGFAEDKLLATKMAFYARNVRGGLGERRVFRVILRNLAMVDPQVVALNLPAFSAFGRFDDLYVLEGTPVEPYMWEYMANIFNNDLRLLKAGKPISLLAKWLKSENASSKETTRLGLKTANKLGLSPRSYRKTLSMMRDYLNVVEHQMSAQDWEKINYSFVPANAMLRYRNAFKKHDEIRYAQYIADVRSGKTEIKASTLFPYDLVHQIMGNRYGRIDYTVEEQWKALPNYIEGENNVLVMADVSGSMSGQPMETSVGLGIYFAQRNKGDYKNIYMTFTGAPHFVHIDPNATLHENVNKVMSTDVGYNTNLEAAFNYVLRHAVQNKVTAEEMPKALIIISDMEIDRYCRDRAHFNFIDQMRLRFAQYGYVLPKLIMWNVAARQDTYLAQQGTPGVQFFSGQSASTFRDVLASINLTAYEAMVKTLNNPMYDIIKIA